MYVNVCPPLNRLPFLPSGMFLCVPVCVTPWTPSLFSVGGECGTLRANSNNNDCSLEPPPPKKLLYLNMYDDIFVVNLGYTGSSRESMGVCVCFWVGGCGYETILCFFHPSEHLVL